MSAVSKICTFDITGEERRWGPFSQCNWCKKYRDAGSDHSICPACRENCHNECAEKQSAECAKDGHNTCSIARVAACVRKYANVCMNWNCEKCKDETERLCHVMRKKEHNDGKHPDCHKGSDYDLAYGCYYQIGKCVDGLHGKDVVCLGRQHSMNCAKEKAAACAAKGHIECGFGDVQCADWNFTSDKGSYYCDCGAGEMKDVKCCLSKKRNTDDDECISPKKQKTEHDPFPKSSANFYATFHLPSTKIKRYACSPDTYVKNFVASHFPRLHNNATLKLIYKTNDDCSHDVSDNLRFSDANEFWFEKEEPKEEPNE